MDLAWIQEFTGHGFMNLQGSGVFSELGNFVNKAPTALTGRAGKYYPGVFLPGNFKKVLFK